MYVWSTGRRFGYEDAFPARDNFHHFPGRRRRRPFADDSIHVGYGDRVSVGGPCHSGAAQRVRLAGQSSSRLRRLLTPGPHHEPPLLGAGRKLGHIRVRTESRLIIACQTTAPRCAASANASIQANTRWAQFAATASDLSLATSLGSSKSPNHETARPPAVDPR